MDLDSGTYTVDFDAEGAQIDQGIATAAYFTGFYLYNIVEDDEFLNGVIAFSQTIMQNMEENTESPCLSPTAPVVARLTLEDKDLNTGRFVPTLEFMGGDPDGEHLPTTAQCIGLYMRSLMNDTDFQCACWDFAEQLVAANDDAQIINSDQGPATNDDSEAPSQIVNEG
jgi:hypothetical protein